MSHDKLLSEVTVPSRYKMTFAEVLARDYKTETFNFYDRILNLEAIAIDAWEMQLTKRRDCTIDTCIGIATHDKSKHFPGVAFNYSNHRLLFIEFKLDCVSPTGVNPSDLKRKVSHTRALFAGIPLDKTDIFIFPERLVPPYKNKFNRLKCDRNKNAYLYMEVLSPNDFNNYIAFEEDVPYQPINSREDIESSIINAAKTDNADELCKILNYWRSQIVLFNNKYQLQESHHISVTVSDIIEEIIQDFADEEEREYLRLEFPNFFNN